MTRNPTTAENQLERLIREGLMVEVSPGSYQQAPGVSQGAILQRLADLAREWAEPRAAECAAQGDWLGALALYSSEARLARLHDRCRTCPFGVFCKLLRDCNNKAIRRRSARCS